MCKFFLKSIPLLFLLLATHLVGAQDIRVDSLKSLLKTAKDKQRLEILNEIVPELSNSDEAYNYAKEASSLARKFDLPEAEVKALNNLGFIYNDKGNADEAFKSFRKALELAKSTGYFKGEMESLLNIGKMYSIQNNIEQAEKSAREVLAKSQKNNDQSLIADAFHELGQYSFDRGNLDQATLMWKSAYSIRIKLGDAGKISRTANVLGDIYYQRGKYDSSKAYYTQNLTIQQKLNNTFQIAIALYNIGNCDAKHGDYQVAIKSFQDASKYFEIIKEHDGIANCLFSIGTVYENQLQSEMSIENNKVNFNKALEYYNNALKIFRDTDNKKGVANSMMAIANIYTRIAYSEYTSRFMASWEDSILRIPAREIEKKFVKGKDFYKQALDISKAIGDTQNEMVVFLNLAQIAVYERQYNRAIEYNTNALKTSQALGLTYQVAVAHNGLGDVNYRKGNYVEAIASYKRGLKLALKSGHRELTRSIYQRLFQVYEKTGDAQEALNYHKLFVVVKDSIFSDASQKTLLLMQTRFETEKKEQSIKQLNTETELQNSVIQRQKWMIFTFIVGFLIILVFVILLFKLYHKIKSNNVQLNEKNDLISHQKQEITDSIRYASRIQTSVLPPLERFDKLLPESFVLFLPRDIVSGDFYWITSTDSKIIVVAADCTGHGVPGAFMSMLGVSFLDEIVTKEGVCASNCILDKLRENIKRTLSQTGKQDEQKDGMDIALCVIDKELGTVDFSGAYNPLYLIREGELQEFKGNKMPIGIHITDNEPFKCTSMNYKPGDTFFIFSDGYGDQFGGDQGRKFMSKPFKRLLTDIAILPAAEQRQRLYDAHIEWKGNHDQVDDILVIGFRL
ncbi:tetratricopeptide repeat protein [Williamwhitmania taraxaci]|uniref:Serine phosphatase RsbU, regulator of sigma subunit n=1 Tax=Williamwhitmania taraxaci TaxID=1640674 RepID=A0A1G6J804_9BACT|nr:tetratricopeptide repeat protein [Williamwhitmania taraxaci]SDC14994.1 Serine phosphatase RsbU, regulator of sigma subunit [Williamwhitmania taraxaci]